MMFGQQDLNSKRRIIKGFILLFYARGKERKSERGVLRCWIAAIGEEFKDKLREMS